MKVEGPCEKKTQPNPKRWSRLPTPVATVSKYCIEQDPVLTVHVPKHTTFLCILSLLSGWVVCELIPG